MAGKALCHSVNFCSKSISLNNFGYLPQSEANEASHDGVHDHLGHTSLGGPPQTLKVKGLVAPGSDRSPNAVCFGRGLSKETAASPPGSPAGLLPMYQSMRVMRRHNLLSDA